MILEIISKKLNITPAELLKYALLAPVKYKRYPIKKRNGGTREIAQPSRDLKLVQRLVIREFFNNEHVFPIHASATAYIKGRSILDNAAPHKENEFLLKLDFVDFFGSIKRHDLENFLSRKPKIKFSENDITFLLGIFFIKDNKDYKLSIGAPSSPFLSNILLFDFDSIISDLCDARSIIYTRYSDDLAFSSSDKSVLPAFLPDVQNIVAEWASPNLVVNNEKTILTSKKYNRHVTGLTISNEGEVSIGRKRKRSIKTQLFLFSKGELEPDEVGKLRGMLNFVVSVEPSFIEILQQKFPTAYIDLMKPKIIES